MVDQLAAFLVFYEGEVLFGTLILTLTLAILAEAISPLRLQSRRQLRDRWAPNLALLLIGQLNLTWVLAVTAVVLESLGTNEQFGVAYWLGLGFWSSALFALLLFEFINYWFHRALHRYPLLWRIHAVHHCDTELDSSTTFRNHPLELLVIAPFTVPLVYLVGLPAASVVLFQVFKTVVLVFVHSNVEIPESLDRKIRLLIATPDYHRVHHAVDKRCTDSNFATILPLFDYLFGTYRALDRARTMKLDIGLEYLDQPADSRLYRLLILPFFWRRMLASGRRRRTGRELCDEVA